MISISGIVKKSIFSIVLVLLCVVGVVAWKNRVLLVRMKTYPQGREISQVAWYEPREVVAGIGADQDWAKVPDDLATQDFFKKIVSTEEYRQVLQYVAETDGRGWLALIQGKLLGQWYAPGVTSETLFNSMSMAKTLLALLVGSLKDEGLISSAGDFAYEKIPAWKASASGLNQVTLKDLLHMAVPFDFDERTDQPWREMVRLHLGTHSREFVEGASVKNQEDLPQNGIEKIFLYSNLAAASLVEVIEKASGQSLGSYLQKKLWLPLEASPSFFWLDRPGGMAKGYCCFFTRPMDWARVGQMILDGGVFRGKRLIDPSWIKEMISPAVANQDFGYMIWLGNNQGTYLRKKNEVGEDFLDPSTLFMSGRGRQRVYILPSIGGVFVRWGENSAKNRSWDDSKIPNLMIRAVKKASARI